jgi:AraC family transcriptional regulator, alkane utilization regulator
MPNLTGYGCIRSRAVYIANFRHCNEFAIDGLAGQLLLVRTGAIELQRAGKSYSRVDRPVLLFFPRGMRYQLYVPEGKPACLLCANTFFETEHSHLLAQALPELLMLPFHESASIKATVELLFHEADLLQTGQAAILDQLCDVLIAQLVRHEAWNGRLPKATLSALTESGLFRALSLMHEEPQSCWSIDALARVAGMSRSKFSKQFHQAVGMPAKQYLIYQRLTVAQDLLCKGLSVKAVCHRVGYTNQSAFTRMFTERAGVSPRAWLARQGRRQ